MAKIAFISRDAYFRIGVAMIIAVLKKHGHVCEVFLEKEEADFFAAVKAFSPDVLSFSCTSGEHNWVIEAAVKLKQGSGALVLVGGPHPTFFPEIIDVPIVDVICRGEGEFAVLELLDKLDRKEDVTGIANLFVKKDGQVFKNPVRDLVEDLDVLPFADRECYDKYASFREDSIIHIFTERGCPFNCTYCYNAESKELYRGKGKYLRQRSPENVIAEIRLLTQKYPKANVVRIYDDLFVHRKDRLFHFLDLYKREIKIPFICNATADLLTDDVVKRLKEGGCDRVAIGVESGNEKIRKSILNKQISNERILEAARICRKYKLRLSTLNMIGLPGETVENAMETIRLNHAMHVEHAVIGIFQPYPGTALAEDARRNGLIDANYNVESMTPFFHYSSVLKQKNIKELCRLQLFFWFAVKYPVFIPVIRLLIKLPVNRIFLFFFTLPILQRKLKYENIGFWEKTRLVIRRIFRVIFFGDAGIEEKGI